MNALKTVGATLAADNKAAVEAKFRVQIPIPPTMRIAAETLGTKHGWLFDSPIEGLIGTIDEKSATTYANRKAAEAAAKKFFGREYYDGIAMLEEVMAHA